MARNRSDFTGSFEERCAALAAAKREVADKMPRCAERESLETEIRQLETATKIQSWLASPELRRPSN
ncbi:MAG: hypothetical protein JWQ51_3069 [Tardiphaga sp.]|jgi:hypothetical protein|nr:hypothetical protein [Tardiphaga sp.]